MAASPDDIANPDRNSLNHGHSGTESGSPLADLAMPVSGTRWSGKYAGIVAGVVFLALVPDDRLVSHAAHPVADQANSTNHEGQACESVPQSQDDAS
jgi:hypothetical protein